MGKRDDGDLQEIINAIIGSRPAVDLGDPFPSCHRRRDTHRECWAYIVGIGIHTHLRVGLQASLRYGAISP